MVRHNNIVPNAHFHKYWQLRVRTWFNQPARALRRRQARQEKAARIFPRPVEGLLRPVVQSTSAKYSMRPRSGRGFTLQELKAAGITKYEAKELGIAVDYRRTNHSEASLKANAQRLKVYKSKLVLFPRKANKGRKGLKKGEKPTKKAAPQRKDVSSAADVAAAVQQREQLPFVAVPQREKARAITADEKKSSAYETLVKARLAKRALGKKDKKEDEKPAGKKNADDE